MAVPMREAAPGKAPPGPPARTLLANARVMQRDALGFLRHLVRQYGDMVRFPFLGHEIYLVNHPAGVKQVLQENQRNYSKDTSDYRLLKLALGEGLLTSEGSFWLRQRRLIQPAFHRQRLAAFGENITAATADLLARWDAGPDQP